MPLPLQSPDINIDNNLHIPGIEIGKSSSQNKLRLQPISQKLREKKEWEIDLSEISIDAKPIGSGSFGSVFVGEYKVSPIS